MSYRLVFRLFLQIPSLEIDCISALISRHLHEDEEIRYILGGSGYFDVRGELASLSLSVHFYSQLMRLGFGGKFDDQWIRIALEKGDLIVLPAG